MPSAYLQPSGCKFHTRCPYVQDICRQTVPQLSSTNPATRWRATWLAKSTKGVPLGVYSAALPSDRIKLSIIQKCGIIRIRFICSTKRANPLRIRWKRC